MTSGCALTLRPPEGRVRDLGMARTLAAAIALCVQATSLYAAFATFGAFTAMGLYALGALTAFVQYRVVRRLS